MARRVSSKPDAKELVVKVSDVDRKSVQALWNQRDADGKQVRTQYEVGQMLLPIVKSLDETELERDTQLRFLVPMELYETLRDRAKATAAASQASILLVAVERLKKQLESEGQWP